MSDDEKEKKETKVTEAAKSFHQEQWKLPALWEVPTHENYVIFLTLSFTSSLQTIHACDRHK